MPTCKVTEPDGNIRVVEAKSKTAATNHVVKDKYKCEVLNAKELTALVKKGYQIEEAKDADDDKSAKADESTESAAAASESGTANE